MSEPYVWTPANSSEVITFANHVRGLSDTNVTLTLTDEDLGLTSVTFNLGGFFDNTLGGVMGWGEDISLGSTFSADGTEQTWRDSGLSYAGTFPGSANIFVSVSFNPSFEAIGAITFTASDGEQLTIYIANVDTGASYAWHPSNGSELIAFANHARGLADTSATITLTGYPTVTAPDTPAAPTLVVGSESITATWVEPDADPAVTSYDLRYRQTGTSAWTDALDLTGLTYTISGLEAITEYEVQVRATSSAGDSSYSASGTGTTTGTAPSAPAAPALVAGSESITATWIEPTAEPDVTSYDLRYRQTDTLAWTDVLDLTGLTYVIPDLAASTEYEVQVRATNTVGTSSYSPSATATTTAVVPVIGEVTVDMGNVLFASSDVAIWPQSLTITDLSMGTTFTAVEAFVTTVQINDNGDLRIRLADSIGANDNDPGPELISYFEQNGRIIYTASDGETLEVMLGDFTEPYRWVPTNSQDVIDFLAHINSLTDQSLHITFTTLSDAAAPSTPAGPTVSALDHDTLNAVWIAPDDGGSPITSYDLRYRRAGTSSWTDVADLTGLTYTITGLQPHTEYQVQVRATNAIGGF